MNGMLRAPTVSTMAVAEVSLSTSATAQTNLPKPNTSLNRDIRPVTPIATLASFETVTSNRAMLFDGRVALEGATSNAIILIDRAVKAVGHVAGASIIMPCDPDKTGFAVDPPKRRISGRGDATTKLAEAVVTLTHRRARAVASRA